MKNISFVVDFSIGSIESEMESGGKHVIKTETIKNRVLSRVEIGGINDDSDYLTDVGLAQIIQQRLYYRGYRSVRTGKFVNLDRCEDIDYLQQMLENADISAQEKICVAKRIKKIRDEKLSGQIEFTIDGSILSGLHVPLSEEEFIEKLEKDAI